MANADTEIGNFLQEQDDVMDKWKLYAINPFAGAYEDGLQAFKDTIKAQQDADAAAEKFKFELIMLALSLCGGGLLTAAFGSAAIKTIVVEKGTEYIINKNMNRAFNVVHFFSTNKTASFALGKVWDEAEKRVTDTITDEMKGRMTENKNNYPSTGQVGAVKMEKSLETYLLEVKVKNADAAYALRANAGKKTDEQRLAELAKLRASRYMAPPQVKLSDGRLAEDIELAFYLEMIMRSDSVYSVVTGSRSISDGMGHGVEYYIKSQSQTDITTNFSDAQQYADYLTKMRTGGFGPNAQVLYQQMGDIVRNKLNTLYKARFGDNFLSGRIGLSHVMLAEIAVQNLAAKNIEKTIAAVSN